MFKIKLILIILCSSILISNSYSMKQKELSQDELVKVIKRNVEFERQFKEEAKVAINELNGRIKAMPDTFENITIRAQLVSQLKFYTDRISRMERLEQEIAGLIPKTKECGKLPEDAFSE